MINVLIVDLSSYEFLMLRYELTDLSEYTERTSAKMPRHLPTSERAAYDEL